MRGALGHCRAQRLQRCFGILPDGAVLGRRQHLVGALAAAHGGGAADAARIEGDHVVALGQTHEVLAAQGQLGDARAAGSAEVQQHRTPGRARRAVAGQRQVERAGGGAGVVERHGDLAALQVGRHAVALARGPGDALPVEAREIGRGRGRGGGAWRGR